MKRKALSILMKAVILIHQQKKDLKWRNPHMRRRAQILLMITVILNHPSKTALMKKNRLILKRMRRKLRKNLKKTPMLSIYHVTV